MSMTFVRRGGLLAALALLVAAAPATAADATKPAACAGILETDGTGDQGFSQTGLGPDDPTYAKTPDNTDLEAVFFNYRGGALTANLQVKNLTKELPSPSDAQGGIWYYAVYRIDDTVHFVRAANRDGESIDYAYGTIDSNGVYTTDGQTKGAFFEGADGVVQIDVPAEAGGKSGAILGGVVGTADYIQGADDAAGINNHVDTAPNEGDVIDPNGESYTVADCPAAGTASEVTAPASGGTAAPATTGSTAGPASSPSLTTLPFRAALTIGKARTARKGRTLRFKVTTSRPISTLRVALKRSNGRGAALATGTLKSLKGFATLSLKLKRALKKGKYALIATGVVDGKRLRSVQQVRVS